VTNTKVFVGMITESWDHAPDLYIESSDGKLTTVADVFSEFTDRVVRIEITILPPEELGE